LIALFSFNLAIVNILPFPALDGGRLVFVLYEWVSGKQSPKKIEKYVNFIGFIVLITIAVLISANDIIRMYK
jgi:regulator of sigma E protease